MHHVYDLFLRLLPEDFRRRYGVEMALDFDDGWREAATGGWRRRVEFGMRASGDLAVSLLREWTRGARLGVVAATASVTALLWGAAGADLIDGRFRRSATFFFATGVLCLFGVIHSPAPQGTLFLPWQTGDTAPFTFAVAYLALGLIVLAAPLLSRRGEPVLQEE